MKDDRFPLKAAVDYGDIQKVREIIEDGNKRARAIARETMAEVREAVKI